MSDLCKGCAACEHQALKMVQETEDVNAEHETGTAFLDLLPDTPQKYLGLYNDSRPQDSKTATLLNMLMVRRGTTTRWCRATARAPAAASCKAWRMLQSKAGIENREYKAQRSVLADIDAGKISKEELFAHAEELLKARIPGPSAAHKAAEPRAPRPGTAPPGADQRPSASAGSSAPSAASS